MCAATQRLHDWKGLERRSFLSAVWQGSVVSSEKNWTYSLTFSRCNAKISRRAHLKAKSFLAKGDSE